MFSILWTVIVGAIVGTIAKFIMPGSNEPKGFILTAILGIVGALVASYIPLVGSWGFIGSVLGAIVVLVVYGMVVKPKA
jgi:uncharacterized membrane protein YeaQ/YmgE (transglycosylase-associated protein family)